MNNIFFYVLSISSISTIVIWLGKLIISRTFDLGFEQYKTTLSKEIEEYKNQLSKISLEHQIKFTRLHDERAEKIKVLYAKVIDLEMSLIHSTTVAQGPEYINDTSRENDCIEKLRALISQLDFDKIFFSLDTVKKFESIITESWDIIFKMRKVRHMASRMNDLIVNEMPIPESYLSETDLWDEANKQTQTEFKSLKEELANDFRQLLGIV